LMAATSITALIYKVTAAQGIPQISPPRLRNLSTLP